MDATEAMRGKNMLWDRQGHSSWLAYILGMHKVSGASQVKVCSWLVMCKTSASGATAGQKVLSSMGQASDFDIKQFYKLIGKKRYCGGFLGNMEIYHFLCHSYYQKL